MHSPIRRQFPALSLVELRRLFAENRRDEVAVRLLWEIKALHAIARRAKQLADSLPPGASTTDEGIVLGCLRRELSDEIYLTEPEQPGRVLSREEIRSRYAALSLYRLRLILIERHDDETVKRLLWEIKALHCIVGRARQFTAYLPLGHKSAETNRILDALRADLVGERYLDEKDDPNLPLPPEEKRLIRMLRG